jgi:aminopeptidase-like protein
MASDGISAAFAGAFFACAGVDATKALSKHEVNDSQSDRVAQNVLEGVARSISPS